MNVLDLFSGIGGFSLGLERAGMRTVAFCEIEPYCRAVLAKHWPGVPVFGDVRALTAASLAEALADAQCSERWPYHPSCGSVERLGCLSSQEESASWVGSSSQIDVICGGFPCQDISFAGKGAGIGGSRSGLWSEFARIIGEIRPRYAIVENVSALLGRGLERVLGDLAALGYDAEWHCIPASYIGASHRRDRIWIVAYPAGDVRGESETGGTERQRAWASSESGDVSDAGRNSPPRLQLGLGSLGRRMWWESEPDVGRVAHGVPARVDRLRALGNAVVPQVVEAIGRAIMEAEPVKCA
jgi:DNA (cytosine-5)-methyltransferase 1